jgi:hypothetical protein
VGLQEKTTRHNKPYSPPPPPRQACYLLILRLNFRGLLLRFILTLQNRKGSEFTGGENQWRHKCSSYEKHWNGWALGLGLGKGWALGLGLGKGLGTGLVEGLGLGFEMGFGLGFGLELGVRVREHDSNIISMHRMECIWDIYDLWILRLHILKMPLPFNSKLDNEGKAKVKRGQETQTEGSVYNSESYPRSIQHRFGLHGVYIHIALADVSCWRHLRFLPESQIQCNACDAHTPQESPRTPSARHSARSYITTQDDRWLQLLLPSLVCLLYMLKRPCLSDNTNANKHERTTKRIRQREDTQETPRRHGKAKARHDTTRHDTARHGTT